MNTSHWQWIPGAAVPTYSYKTLVAVYRRTGKDGFADYQVFPAALPVGQRKPELALAVGGLPSRALCDVLVSRAAFRARGVQS